MEIDKAIHEKKPSERIGITITNSATTATFVGCVGPADFTGIDEAFRYPVQHCTFASTTLISRLCLDVLAVDAVLTLIAILDVLLAALVSLARSADCDHCSAYFVHFAFFAIFEGIVCFARLVYFENVRIWGLLAKECSSLLIS